MFMCFSLGGCAYRHLCGHVSKMKILKPGKEQIWSRECECTGAGNTGKPGCRALLLIEEGDLFYTYLGGARDETGDACKTFKCAQCGVLTDIKDVPSYVVIRSRQ